MASGFLCMCLLFMAQWILFNAWPERFSHIWKIPRNDFRHSHSQLILSQTDYFEFSFDAKIPSFIVKEKITFLSARGCEISKPSRSLAQTMYSDMKNESNVYFCRLLLLSQNFICIHLLIWTAKPKFQPAFYPVFIFMCVLWLGVMNITIIYRW